MYKRQAKELNKLFAQIKGTTEENAVSTMAVRSMAKAYYTTDNICLLYTSRCV